MLSLVGSFIVPPLLTATVPLLGPVVIVMSSATGSSPPKSSLTVTFMLVVPESSATVAASLRALGSDPSKSDGNVPPPSSKIVLVRFVPSLPSKPPFVT